MERAISASEANQHFSEMLREVADGETFIVTSRGRPVAKVIPIDSLDAQGPELDALLDYVVGLPRRRLEAWHRSDLYE